MIAFVTRDNAFPLWIAESPAYIAISKANGVTGVLLNLDVVDPHPLQHPL